MNIPTFELWEQTAECRNIAIRNDKNRAIYELPFGKLSIAEDEHWHSEKNYSWLNGLSLPKNKETENLLKRYDGILIEEPYADEHYFGQFKTVEGAYNFARDNYHNIMNEFKNNLKNYETHFK